jgi:hypothetical protein
MKKVIYLIGIFMATCQFIGSLVYFPHFGLLLQEKSGNPEIVSKNMHAFGLSNL